MFPSELSNQSEEPVEVAAHYLCPLCPRQVWREGGLSAADRHSMDAHGEYAPAGTRLQVRPVQALPSID
jgi:hypothetical protein